MLTFPRGIHPKDKKKLSKNEDIKEMPAPQRVFIPLNQHLGTPAAAVVAVGDEVKMGQLIGRSSGARSAHVFSSVSGKVAEVNDRGGVVTIVIDNDGLDTEESLPKLSKPTAQQIIERVAEAGIVGMGGAGFPTALKLSPPAGTVIDTLIINAAECEPYITCDYRLMLEYTEQVIKGAVMLGTAVAATKILFGVEDNKLDAVDRLNHYISKLNTDIPCEAIAVKTKYPQGAEKQLIFAATGRVVARGALPSSVGACVCNVHTAFSTYLAVNDGQPLYKRVMTVSGGGINNPSNVFVRGGTQLKEVIEFCGGQKGDVVRLVNGGPMMGTALGTDLTPTTKTTSCVLLLTNSETDVHSRPSNCINCAKCAHVCPMNLMPMYIDCYAFSGEYSEAKRYGAMDCIECGCCSYTCPAKRPLVQSIKLAKKNIRERNI